MRPALRIFGLLLVVALVLGGGQGLYEALRYRQPESLPCEEALRGPLPSRWVRLVGCRVNGAEAAWKTHFTSPAIDVYVPLIPKDPRTSKTVGLVLKTKDPELLDAVKDLAALDPKDSKAVILFMVKNEKRLKLDKDITGMVDSGIDSKISRHLKELDRHLADDFAVIDEGRKPSFAKSGLLLLAGLSVLVFGVLGRKGGSRPGPGRDGVETGPGKTVGGSAQASTT